MKKILHDSYAHLLGIVLDRIRLKFSESNILNEKHFQFTTYYNKFYLNKIRKLSTDEINDDNKPANYPLKIINLVIEEFGKEIHSSCEHIVDLLLTKIDRNFKVHRVMNQYTEKKKVLYETNEDFVDLKKVSYIVRNPKRVSRSETISKPFLGFVD